MAAFLRILTALVGVAALVPIVGGFLFLVGMARGFGAHGSDMLLFSGMLLAIGYFLAAIATCAPRFPVSALERFGLFLHLIVMPAAVLLVCGGVGSRAAVYFFPGVLFALLWFAMARSVTRNI